MGAQPMPNEAGDVQLVFNGEIYNHRELREGLGRRGHHFRGHSDTEVIVHLYEELGPAIASHLRGIFAFAVYDRARSRVVLVRDRFGVKPLYYARVDEEDGEWIFASEIKAILAHPRFRPRLDRQACYDFLGLGFVPEPMTGFANVAALPPGGVLELDAGGARRSTHAAVRAVPRASLTLAEALDDVGERVEAAVARQREADVPVGALLSGGIDSALVVAAHSRLPDTPLQTFTVGFPDAAHDESRAAQRVADHCATEHHTIRAAPDTLRADDVLALLRHFDQPFADPSLLPTYWVAQAIRDRGLVCALSGDGGDEVFGGYPRFWQSERLFTLMRAPAWVRRTGDAVGMALLPVTRDLGRRVTKVARIAELARDDASHLLAGLSTYLSEEQKADLVVADARAALAPTARVFDGYARPAVEDLEDLSQRLSETMFRVTLPGGMLRKVDMMSMRAGIEVRVPLLDEDLVALGMSLPHRLKTDGRRGKLVARALADRWLPRDVARAPKRGFTPPVDLLASGDLHTALADLLTGPGSRTRGVLSPHLVGIWLSLFARHRAGAADSRISRGGLSQRLLTLLSLETWMRDHALSW
jgi:asparagine synthase (glutamine-hydrolysing)